MKKKNLDWMKFNRLDELISDWNPNDDKKIENHNLYGYLKCQCSVERLEIRQWNLINLKYKSCWCHL